MFAQSHLVLARAITGRLSADLPYRMPMRAFYFGSVYPDMSPRYKRVKHKKKAALPVVQELIDSVVKSNRQEGLTNQQAMEMGIICHFMCDFFCQAHNFEEYSYLPTHLHYEMQMNRVIRQEINSPSFPEVSCEAFRKKQDAAGLIQNTHDEYLDAPRTLITDLSYAVTCSSRALDLVLQEMQVKQTVPAAKHLLRHRLAAAIAR